MEKEIKAMVKILDRCDADKMDTHCDLPSSEEYAYYLYYDGYRKQVEGEWKFEHETYGKIRCSVCGKECPTERKPDPYEDYQMTDFYITSPFCPNCGAHMKGGEE
jgi:hypothetical protein